MTFDQLNREWYSKDFVQNVQVPNVSSYRSRYDLKERLLLNDYTLVIRNMRKDDMIPKESSSDSIHRVEGFEHNRPDIIAEKYYGDSRLAWVILAANGLSSLFDFNVGTIIRIPSLTSLYGAGGVLSR